MKIFVSLLLLIFFTTTQALTVQITEISPHKVNTLEEWFEFSISETESVDMTGWKIQNTKGTTKAFEDFEERLEVGIGGIREEGIEGMEFSVDGTAYFSWTKSPLSLPNDGGSIMLLDESDTVLDQVEYPKTKSGTVGGVKYAEIWNRDDQERLVPLIFRDDPNSSFMHTKGSTNHLLPTLPEEVDIKISEVSPQRVEDHDFVELYVGSGSVDPVNLKYMTLKHNGTKIWEVEHDLLVAPGDYIILYLNDALQDFVRSTGKVEQYSTALSGLSAGSGTIELILFTGTSLETTVDFLCYQDEKLSQTEASRVAKNIQSGHWTGDCVEIGEQIKNESVARPPNSGDSNSRGDWFRHYHGSPGEDNLSTNQTPQAVIRIQASGKTAGTTPFSLNLTGEDSTDPDGDHDLQSFLWTINGVVFSEKENPGSYKIEVAGDYTVTLAVTDYSGATNSVSIEVKTWEAGNSSSGGFGDKKEVIQELFTSTEKQKSQTKESIEGFFGAFLSQAPEIFWQNLENSHYTPSSIPTPHYHPQLTARGKLEFYHQTQQITANDLGRIFLEEGF